MPQSEYAIIMLCYFTDDPVLIALANKYWEADRSGIFWASGIEGIRKELGVQLNGKIASEIRKLATAYAINFRCESCGGPIDIPHRSAVAYPSFMCSACRDSFVKLKELGST